MSQIFAFIFPGQGSQSLGMLQQQGAAQSLVIETFDEASDALGYDLWALCQSGPAEKLDETDKTQPAILTASIALWRLWLTEGGKLPAFVAGHSFFKRSGQAGGKTRPTDATSRSRRTWRNGGHYWPG